MDKPQLDSREEWLQHPVTKYIMFGLEEKIKYYQDCWMNGNYSDSDTSATIQLNAEAIGNVNEVREILLNIQDIAKGDE